MPELLVFTTRWVLVLGLVTVTVAPATTAPVGSTTVPVISPVGPCAHERAATKTIVNGKVIERRIPVLLLKEVYISQPPYGVPVRTSGYWSARWVRRSQQMRMSKNDSTRKLPGAVGSIRTF